MALRALVLLVLALASFRPAFGAVGVAFFEYRDEKGQPVPLEAGGRFYHVAISHQGQWLHADSYYGVQLWDEAAMRKFGFKEVLVGFGDPEPTAEKVRDLVGTKFDKSYTWDRPGTTYCAKLVGQLLAVPPKPMEFKGDLFPAEWQSRRGEPGLSPDDIYEALKSRGFRPASRVSRCEFLFAP